MPYPIQSKIARWCKRNKIKGASWTPKGFGHSILAVKIKRGGKGGSDNRGATNKRQRRFYQTRAGAFPITRVAPRGEV